MATSSQSDPQNSNKLNSPNTTEEFELTQSKLEELKTQMTGIVDAEALNASYLSQAALYWGKTAHWKKITVGILLSVPLFIVSLIASNAVLLTISLFIFFIFTISSILLNNHQSLIQSNSHGIKQRMGNLTDAFGVVVLSLNDLQKGFSEQLKTLEEENDQFSTFLKNFDVLYKKRVEQNQGLEETGLSINNTNNQIEQLIELIGVKHQEQLARHQDHLKGVEDQFEQSKQQLINKINELQKTNKDLNHESEQLRGLSEQLKDNLIVFSRKLMSDDKQRATFREEIGHFLNNKSESFHLITEQYSATQEKFSSLHKKYNLLYQEYLTLLEKDQDQVKRLEKLDLFKLPTENTKQSNNLAQLGIYAKNLPKSDTDATPENNLSTALGG